MEELKNLRKSLRETEDLRQAHGLQRKAGVALMGLVLVGLLAGCAPTGPEPIALDQDPGNGAAPSAIGN